LIGAGVVSGPVSKVLSSARSFVRRGATFPFSFHSRAETVFWPGCSLAGMAPEVVISTRRLLSGSLGEEVGLALDCCGDPAYGLGDRDTPRARLQDIRQTFGSKGVTRVIVGCANCVKIMRDQLPGVAVEHVLEVLPEDTKARMPSGSGAYLHHPCPSYRFESIQKAARRLCSDVAKAEHTTPLCCGKGGGLPALSQETANACADEILRQAGPAPLVTYCMGCRDQFLRRGRQAFHLLELIVDSRPKRKPVSSARQWLNRLALAFRAHFRKGMV
jgi:Fe-S oxidoreductase